MLKFIVLLFLCVGYVNISFGDAVIFSGDGVKALKNKIKFKDGGDVTYDGTNIDINVGDSSIHQIQPDGAFLLQPQSGFGGSGGRLKLGESAENGTDFIGIYGHENLSVSYGLKFPNVAPAANQVLQSDAGGQFSWVTLPAGSDATRINDTDNDTYVDTDEITNVVVISSASTKINWNLGVLTLDTLPEALLSPKMVFKEPLRAGFPQEEIGIKAPDDIPDGGTYTLELDPDKPLLGQYLNVNNIEGALYDLNWTYVDEVRDDDGDTYIRAYEDTASDNAVSMSSGGTKLVWYDISQLDLYGSAGAASISFYEAAANGTNFINVRAPFSLGADYYLILPPQQTAAEANFFLQTNGSASTRWFHPSRLQDVITMNDPLQDDTFIDVDNVVGQIQMGFTDGFAASQNGGWFLQKFNGTGPTGAFLQLTDSTNSQTANVSIAAPQELLGNYTITLPQNSVPDTAGYTLVSFGSTFNQLTWEKWDPTRIQDAAGTTYIDADFVPNFLWMQAGDGSTARLGGGDFRLQSNLGSTIDNVELQFYEDPDVGADYVGLKAPTSVNASYALTLPADGPTANQTLQSDASGVLSWVAAAAAGFDLPYCVGRVGNITNFAELVGVVCGNGFTGVTSLGSSGGINTLTITGPAVPTTELHGLTQPWGVSTDWRITQSTSDAAAGTFTTRMYDSANVSRQTFYMFLIIGIP